MCEGERDDVVRVKYALFFEYSRGYFRIQVPFFSDYYEILVAFIVICWYNEFSLPKGSGRMKK